jgi:hypothetical protein
MRQSGQMSRAVPASAEAMEEADKQVSKGVRSTMGEYDKYIYFETPPNPFHPPGSFPGTEMFGFDSRLVPGAARFMVAWFAGPWKEEDTMKPHAHNHDEIVMFLGSDYSNPQDLGGEVEFWFEDTKYLFTKSCMIFMPKSVQHAPMLPRRVDDPNKPILFVGTLPAPQESDVTYYSRDPKWANFQDPPEVDGVEWMD